MTNKYALYFLNHNTEVIVAAYQYASNEYNARHAFTRRLKKGGDIESGENYRIIIADGSRSLDNIPEALFDKKVYQTAR